MSALPQFAGARDDIALVLLGNGVVGGALLQLLATPAAAGVRLVGVANSTRQVIDVRGIAAECVAIQQRPQEREGSWIVNGDLEVELRKPAGISTSPIEDANEWACDTQAPSQALGDTVAHRDPPDGRGIVVPRRYEKSGNRTALGLEQRVEPRR